MKQITFQFLFWSLAMLAASESNAQTYQFRLYPWDAELAEQINLQIQQEDVRFVEDPPRDEYYLGTLRWESTSRNAFLGPGAYRVKPESPEEIEDTGPEEVPFNTKPHRMRQLRAQAGLDPETIGTDRGESSEAAENVVAEGEEGEATPAEEKEEKKGFFARLFGSDDTAKDVKARHSGDRVVISAPEPRLSGGSVLEELPEAEQESQNNSQSSDEVPSALVPRPPEANYSKSRLNLYSNAQADTGVQGEKGFFSSIFGSLSSPFGGSDDGDSGNRSYTMMAEYEFPTGRELTLPDVKSRNRMEMEHLFSQLAAQTALWLRDDLTTLVTALNSASSIRSAEDLYNKIENAKLDPDWLNSTERELFNTRDYEER